jgi:predicted transposase/invertase (TIGR01784 family)
MTVLERILTEKIQSSWIEGREEGREEGHYEVAKNLIAMNLPIKDIEKATGLDRAAIMKLME